MKTLIAAILIALCPALSEAKIIKCSTKQTIVAVIDTGLTISHNDRLCATGHKDFSNYKSSPQYKKVFDTIDVEVSTTGKREKGQVPKFITVPAAVHAHGTNVAGLIYDRAGKKANYCMVILRFWYPGASGEVAGKATVEAIRYATKIGADVINYSAGGTAFLQEEQDAVKAFLNTGGTFIAAAGNEETDLAKQPYYPAMDDDRVIVVGSAEGGDKEKRYKTSNFGHRVNRWEDGQSQVGFGVGYSGTSQATAIVTGKMLKESECEK